jgi:hypothetical protein
MQKIDNNDLVLDPMHDDDLRRKLMFDFLTFARFFFKRKTGRQFQLSQPDSNESHFLTIARELEDIFRLKHTRLSINVPPGWGKSELCKAFVCWAMAHYPDSKFLYISHSFELATLHTASIKQTMCLPLYKKLFGIDIRRDSSAKDFFMTVESGAVAAFGSQGGITGHDAGLPGQSRFTGAIIIDDIHKPEDIHSDTIRERVKRNYFETIERRLRSPNVPIILIGQRLHEDDLPAHILAGADGQEWRTVIIKALDDVGNARYPEVNPKSQLLTMREKQPYVFASQYQQDPMPSGGALFKESWFPRLDQTPNILTTFITCDSAETEKEYNDATVFSFWGVYNVRVNDNVVDNLYALHWIDCVELRIEPKDLQDEFIDFWSQCMRYHVKPKFAAIEKKSTGVTLTSVLSEIQGLRIIPIERTGTINSKTNRFLEMQQFIASKLITFPATGKHTAMCIKHMSKITANNVHRFDDIADTCYDAIKMALIDRIIINKELQHTNYDVLAKGIFNSYDSQDRLRKKAYRK